MPAPERQAKAPPAIEGMGPMTRLTLALLALAALYLYVEGVDGGQTALVLTAAGGFYLLVSAFLLR